MPKIKTNGIGIILAIFMQKRQRSKRKQNCCCDCMQISAQTQPLPLNVKKKKVLQKNQMKNVEKPVFSKKSLQKLFYSRFFLDTPLPETAHVHDILALLCSHHFVHNTIFTLVVVFLLSRK